MNLGDRELSNKYIQKALKDAKLLKRNDKIALAYMNLGINHLELNHIDSSSIYLNKALRIYKEFGIKNKLPRLDYTFGRLYLKTKNYNKAIPFMLEAEKIFNYSETLQDEHLKNYNNLYEVYKSTGNIQKAIYYLEKTYYSYKKLDSIKNKKIVFDIETKYQTQQKENEILQLSNENIQKEAALTKSRFTIYSILGVLVLILGIGYFYRSKRKQQYKLALLKNTVNSVEQEKSRIGRELHDGIAGSLIKLVHDTETAQIQLSHKLLQTYNEVRNLSHQLDNTPVHGELFLERVLDIIPENAEHQTFDFTIEPRHLQLNEPHGTHLFRIIQELFANNIKYAKATKTSIDLSLKEDLIKLHYKDNGVGTTNFKKGNGYKNIEDRITLLNGKIEISTQKGKGFEVTVTLAYKK